jgi:rod shape-determining protein MreD
MGGVRRLPVYTLLIAVFLMQLLLLDHVKIGSAKPDLLALLVIFFAIFFGAGAGSEMGFVAGLFKDIYSLDTFGVNTVLLSFAGLVAGGLSPKLFRESKITQFLLVFVFSVLYMSSHYFISLLMLKVSYATFTECLRGFILPSSFYTAVLSFFIFPILINRWRLKESAEYL